MSFDLRRYFLVSIVMDKIMVIGVNKIIGSPTVALLCVVTVLSSVGLAPDTLSSNWPIGSGFKAW